MTIDDVRRAIDLDEPDYPALAQELGAEAVPFLQDLVAEDDPRIASKAAYLAALLDEDDATGVVDLASRSRHRVVRAAAAASLPHLAADPATQLGDRLLDDPDAGIRASTVRAAARTARPSRLRQSLERVAREDENEDLRDLARDVIRGQG